MAVERKGLRGLRTMGSLVDRRKARTAAGALLELSALSYEKDLLNRELQRWQRRHAEITARLAEIAAKEVQLREVAGTPLGEPIVTGQTRKPADLPEVRATEFSY